MTFVLNCTHPAEGVGEEADHRVGQRVEGDAKGDRHGDPPEGDADPVDVEFLHLRAAEVPHLGTAIGKRSAQRLTQRHGGCGTTEGGGEAVVCERGQGGLGAPCRSRGRARRIAASCKSAERSSRFQPAFRRS